MLNEQPKLRLKVDYTEKLSFFFSRILIFVVRFIQITAASRDDTHNRNSRFVYAPEKFHNAVLVSMPNTHFYDPLGVNSTTLLGIGKHLIYLQALRIMCEHFIS